MYKYAATDSLFDGVSNIYLISIATVFLAVIIAFYCSNFLKDENETQLKQLLNDVNGDEEEEGFVNGTSTGIDNDYYMQKHPKNFEPNEYDRKNMDYNPSYSANESSDYDTDETHGDGLVSKLKSKRVKDMEAKLTSDQLEEEKRIEREQLAAIFELLKRQEEELNTKEINESELHAQLALYR